MATRQEIKDETNKLMDRCYTKGSRDLMVFQRQKFLNELLPLLDRLGVAIRVEREMPNDCIYRSPKQEEAYCEGRDTVRRAGHVAVVSLIWCSSCKKEICECSSINRGSFAKYVEEEVDG